MATRCRIDNDIIVLANPEIAKLPGWVIALVVAGGLARFVHRRRSVARDFLCHLP